MKRRFVARNFVSLVVALAFFFSFFASLDSALATGESVTAPSDTTVINNQNNLALSDDFQVSGFAEDANLLVSITVSGSTSAKVNLPTTTGLTLESGYSSWTNTSQINFTGTQEDINVALDAMTLNSGAVNGDATLSIQVSEKIENTAFFNGHLYEFVPGNISYPNARSAARLRTINGVNGYLVTITSDEEHNFVLSKIQGAYNIWIALSDRAVEGDWVLDPYDGSPEQGTLVWRGLSNGSAQGGNYAKWCGGEPNNSGNEDAAVTKWNGGNCWNDLPDSYSSVGGYVAEYNMPASVVVSDSMIITVEAPYYNAVENLVGTANSDGSVTLTWDVPISSNLEPYIYVITWYDLNNEIESGGWVVWTYATNTTYNVGYFQFPGTTGYGDVRFKVKAGSSACVGEGQGSCVYGPDSSVNVFVIDPTPPTTTVPPTTVPPTTVPPTTVPPTTVPPTTTSTTTTTTIYVPTVTTTTEYVAPTTTSTVVETTTTTTEPKPEDSTTTQPENTVPETTIPEETQPKKEKNETSTTTANSNDKGKKEDKEDTATNTTNTTTTEPQSSGGDKPDNGQIPQESTNPIQEPSNEAKEKEKALDAINQITKSINEITEEDKREIVAAVVAILANGVDTSIATELASNPAVLASVDVEQAKEIFAAIDEGKLTDEQGGAIVAAIQGATDEVRNTFENQVNIFAGVFDNYVAVGSTIDVGTRRAVIAVAALQQVTMGATVVAATSGNIGGQSSSSNNPNDAARKEEEEEEEEAGELEGTDLRPWLDTISIWIYVNGIRKFSMKKFLQKFWYETLALGFTISSSVILWVTLSGFTRNVAITATILAFAAHYYLVMWKQQNGSNE